MKTSTVIVVGGGPAGCAAAYILARKSIDVTVLERGKPGKDKACGDALVASAIKSIGLFGINQERIKALGGYCYNRINLYANDLLVQQSVCQSEAGWVIPWTVIDQEIRNVTAEYASFQYETCVTDLTVEPQGSLRLSSRRKDGAVNQIECEALILATGSTNRLSRKIGIDGKPRKAYAVSTYVEMQQPDALMFQFLVFCKPGYGWIFPVSERVANVGVCALNGNPKVDLRSLGEELVRKHHARPLGKWRGGFGQLWSGLGQYWHHPSGVLSCGDAAGLMNPYGGEGMTAALRSGEQAGKAILSYLSGNRNSLKLEEYSEWITKHFGRQYRSTPVMQTWNDLCGTCK